MADKNHSQYRHGLAKTPIYNVWASIKERCDTPSTTSYKNYGARGITYDPKWKTFEGFMEDMSEGYKKGLSIERIDNNANYSKENCKWSNWQDQCNNRRSNRWFTIGGRTQTLAQWTRESEVKPSLVRQRYYVLKWPIERALGVASHS